MKKYFFLLSFVAVACNSQTATQQNIPAKDTVVAPPADTKMAAGASDAEIEGTYRMGGDKGYYQQFTLKSTGGEGYHVVFTASKEDCSFEGDGTRSSNVITLNLAEKQKSMTSQMDIRIQGNTASVDTRNPENHYDLNYFCRGGASLAGDYIRQ